MKTNTERLQNFPLEGGALCLDFINTVHDRTTEGELYDYISGWEEWTTWLFRTGILEKSAKLDPEGDFKKIAETREMLYQVFKAVIDKVSLSEPLLKGYNQLLKAANSHVELVMDNVGPSESLIFNESKPLDYLFPILRSAHDILTAENVRHVKQCPNCGWLFLDTSKNKRRRWCNMKTCGSSQKAKRYYRRRKNSNK
nr:CGNR zinc finger domain-containing protein [Allomuricauda sp.]